MNVLVIMGLVAFVHRLLLLDRDIAEHGPVRIICPSCQRDIAPQVYHWHMESHQERRR